MAKITLTSLAFMINKGFTAVDRQFTVVDRRISDLRHELITKIEKLEQGQDDILLKLDRKTNDFETKELTRRVDKLEKKLTYD